MRSPSGRPSDADEWSTASMAKPQVNCMSGMTPVTLRQKRKTSWRLEYSSSRIGRVPAARLAPISVRSCVRGTLFRWAQAYFGYQRGEEFLGHAVHHTCDQTRPELRELSAYLGLYFIR